ncbi:hypothetical protein M378DRAFT_75661 [Amanita muscaria Koide BX008]|uniref:FAD/NAD(P)-binding domain-containing protein n=1 Tax=Amanita muscaria (strain Koide BX008) TaxID=946122 RepID=A0A0C2WWB8_AMAMK|nr:hypothetical protein M378DRAFT_75661 [Amanita muscaria Koide BX008]
MVNVRHFIFSLIGTQLPAVYESPNPEQVNENSIAILGAGSAGLAMLKTLLDFPDHNLWDIALFEERENVGGIWLPDPDPSPPPVLPETPLYPALHTNTPVPMMTYPNFPFPAGTHLYPSHHHVEAYHVRYAHHYNLLPYIRFNHRVLITSWIGAPDDGFWNITFSNHKNETHHQAFRYLVVASGNNHIPRIPTWPGQKEWLTSSTGREIVHSAWFRRPEKYSNKSVLIVGYSASGQDETALIAPLAANTYVSTRSENATYQRPIPSNVIKKPAIAHFTKDSAVFVDKTEINVDSVLLATGYQIRKPFLEAGNGLLIKPTVRSSESSTTTLISNTKYIFPLHRHIFSLSTQYPTTALSFIGLPSHIANCPSDTAQAIFAAHAIRNASILPSRDQMLQELAEFEQKSRDEGLDPYITGHKLPDNTRASDYQDELLDYLKEKGVIEDEGKEFVEEWRREIYSLQYLRRGWGRIEELGVGDDWVRGVETEEEWSGVMARVNEWQKAYEES